MCLVFLYVGRLGILGGQSIQCSNFIFLLLVDLQSKKGEATTIEIVILVFHYLLFITPQDPCW